VVPATRAQASAPARRPIARTRHRNDGRRTGKAFPQHLRKGLPSSPRLGPSRHTSPVSLRSTRARPIRERLSAACAEKRSLMPGCRPPPPPARPAGTGSFTFHPLGHLGRCPREEP
jgi:hypothetical protein